MGKHYIIFQSCYRALQFGCFYLCSFKIRLSLLSDLAMGAPLSSVGWKDTYTCARELPVLPSLLFLSPLLSLYVKMVMKLTFWKQRTVFTFSPYGFWWSLGLGLLPPELSEKISIFYSFWYKKLMYLSFFLTVIISIFQRGKQSTQRLR